MILELHQARLRRAQEGKKPCAADEALLAQAERLVHQEFSCVLGLTPAKTVEFIRRELQCSLARLPFCLPSPPAFICGRACLSRHAVLDYT